MELQEDEHARRRLQQQYASDKAAWDVEWAVLKCRLEQVPGPPRLRQDRFGAGTVTQIHSESERKRAPRRKPGAAASCLFFKLPALLRHFLLPLFPTKQRFLK